MTLSILFVGILSVVLLMVVSRAFRIAVVSFICFLAIWIIIEGILKYWSFLISGDQDVFEMTICLVTLLMVGLGLLVWNALQR